MAMILVIAISEPLHHVPDLRLHGGNLIQFFLPDKSASISCSGDLVDIVADGRELPQNVRHLIRRSWAHLHTGDQIADELLRGVAGQGHLLLQVLVFRFIQTEQDRDTSFSDNMFLLQNRIGVLGGFAP